MADRLTEPRLFHYKGSLRRDQEGRQRGDYTGAAVVTEGGLGKYGEAVLKGNVFHKFSATLTLAASGGNISGSSAGADTNTALFNPTTSTKLLVLQRVTIAVHSGTIAAGGLFHGFASGQTIATSISGAARGVNALVGRGETSEGWVFTQGTQAALTGSAAPTTIGVIASGTATAQAVVGIQPIVADVDGSIVLPPGAQYMPLWAAVGGTPPVYSVGYQWMEVPLDVL